MLNIFRGNAGWMYSLCWTDTLDRRTTCGPEQQIYVHMESDDRERHSRDSNDLHQLASRTT